MDVGPRHGGVARPYVVPIFERCYAGSPATAMHRQYVNHISLMRQASGLEVLDDVDALVSVELAPVYPLGSAPLRLGW